MDTFGKIRKYFFPFILIVAILVTIIGTLLNTIKDSIIEYRKELILSIGTAVFIVPIVMTFITGWEIPGLLIFYDFIYGTVVLILMAGMSDGRQYEREGGGYNGNYGYYKPSETNRTYGYDNYFYNHVNREKERNGGFTDKEVLEKKQMIRKKLEKNRMLDKKETKKEEVSL